MLFILFSYLYFVQGAIIGISGTMPYIYKELPDVHTMALFHAVTLPYSLKFLLGTIFLRQHPFFKGTATLNMVRGRPGSLLASFLQEPPSLSDLFIQNSNKLTFLQYCASL